MRVASNIFAYERVDPKCSLHLPIRSIKVPMITVESATTAAVDC